MNEYALFSVILLYGLSFAASLKKAYTAVFLFNSLAFVIASFLMAMRCYLAWPMLPMYTGLWGEVVLLGALVLIFFRDQKPQQTQREKPLLLLTLFLLSLLTLLFPKDFYLPFIRSATLWAHLLFWAGSLGKSLFILSSLTALCAIISKKEEQKRFLQKALAWAFAGFIALSLSMFCGEIWSYLGWGTPVVWHDPAVATSMALWFFWVCLLHLHYSRKWNKTARAWMMAAGGLFFTLLSILPDLGPFRWPFA